MYQYNDTTPSACSVPCSAPGRQRYVCHSDLASTLRALHVVAALYYPIRCLSGIPGYFTNAASVKDGKISEILDC